jgi:hypothetical protein
MAVICSECNRLIPGENWRPGECLCPHNYLGLTEQEREQVREANRRGRSCQ